MLGEIVLLLGTSHRLADRPYVFGRAFLKTLLPELSFPKTPSRRISRHSPFIMVNFPQSKVSLIEPTRLMPLGGLALR
jgi:hypothetical protein